MTSPVYSALPQELLLEVDPMRPATKIQHFLSANNSWYLIKDKKKLLPQGERNARMKMNENTIKDLIWQ